MTSIAIRLTQRLEAIENRLTERLHRIEKVITKAREVRQHIVGSPTLVELCTCLIEDYADESVKVRLAKGPDPGYRNKQLARLEAQLHAVAADEKAVMGEPLPTDGSNRVDYSKFDDSKEFDDELVAADFELALARRGVLEAVDQADDARAAVLCKFRCGFVCAFVTKIVPDVRVCAALCADYDDMATLRLNIDDDDGS